MSLLSEFKGNVVLSTDTGTSTKVGKLDANLAFPVANTIMSIGSNVTTGTIRIGESITSGNINIGTSISSGDHILIGSSTAGSRVIVDGALVSNKMEGYVSSSAMGIGNNITDGSITIGSAQTGNMLLGSTSSITQVQGTFVSNSHNGKTATANMTIASTATSSTLTVGSNMTASGGILLGSSACSTTVNGTLKTDTIASITAAGTTNINTSGNGSTTIGTSGGTGSITLNRQPTIGYGLSSDSIASLSLLGGSFFSENRFTFTVSTTLTAYAPINGLPRGRYLFTIYVFMGAQTSSTKIECFIVRSNSAIVNNQTSGLVVTYGGNEIYTQTTTTGNSMSLNSPFFYDVAASPDNNVAIGILAGVGLAGTQVFQMVATRIA